jgi:hypothetical protein
MLTKNYARLSAQPLTNANFYAMLDIFVAPTEETPIQDDYHFYFLRREHGVPVERDEHPFQPGNYYLVAKGELLLFIAFLSFRKLT